jgi:hypothetical protein
MKSAGTAAIAGNFRDITRTFAALIRFQLTAFPSSDALAYSATVEFPGKTLLAQESLTSMEPAFRTADRRYQPLSFMDRKRNSKEYVMNECHRYPTVEQMRALERATRVARAKAISVLGPGARIADGRWDRQVVTRPHPLSFRET